MAFEPIKVSKEEFDSLPPLGGEAKSFVPIPVSKEEFDALPSLAPAPEPEAQANGLGVVGTALEAGKSLARETARTAQTIGGAGVEMAGSGLAQTIDAVRAPIAFPGMTSEQFRQALKARAEQTPTANPFEGQRQFAEQVYGPVVNAPALQQDPRIAEAEYLGDAPLGVKASKAISDTAGIVPSMGATVAAFMLGGPVGAGVMGGGIEAAAAYDDAKQRGLTDEQAIAEAATTGVGTGVLNALPFAEKITKFVPKAARGRVSNFFLRGLAEGATETAEGGLSPFAELASATRQIETKEDMRDFLLAIKDGVWDESGVFLPAMISGGVLTGSATPTSTQAERTQAANARAKAEAEAALKAMYAEEMFTPEGEGAVSYGAWEKEARRQGEADRRAREQAKEQARLDAIASEDAARNARIAEAEANAREVQKERDILVDNESRTINPNRRIVSGVDEIATQAQDPALDPGVGVVPASPGSTENIPAATGQMPLSPRSNPFGPRRRPPMAVSDLTQANQPIAQPFIGERPIETPEGRMSMPFSPPPRSVAPIDAPFTPPDGTTTGPNAPSGVGIEPQSTYRPAGREDIEGILDRLELEIQALRQGRAPQPALDEQGQPIPGATVDPSIAEQPTRTEALRERMQQAVAARQEPVAPQTTPEPTQTAPDVSNATEAPTTPEQAAEVRRWIVPNINALDELLTEAIRKGDKEEASALRSEIESNFKALDEADSILKDTELDDSQGYWRSDMLGEKNKTETPTTQGDTRKDFKKSIREAEEGSKDRQIKEFRDELVQNGSLARTTKNGNQVILHKSSKRPDALQITTIGEDGVPIGDAEHTDISEAIRDFRSRIDLSERRRADLPDVAPFLDKGDVLFVYEPRLRPVDIGTIPKAGFVGQREGGKWGRAVFDRPLSEKELSDYELNPIGFEDTGKSKIKLEGALNTAPKDTQDAEFAGMQERPRGQAPIPLYNIPEGEGKTTVTAETARAKGFNVPEPPVVPSTEGQLSPEAQEKKRSKIMANSGQSVITRSARSEGKLQVTHFTEKGVPKGHDEYSSLKDAIKDNPVDDPLMKEPRHPDDLVRASVGLTDIGTEHGDYAYGSENRPFGFASPLSDVGVTYTVDGKRGVLFTTEPIPRDMMRQHELLPLSTEARDATIDGYIEEKGLSGFLPPAPTQSPQLTPETQAIVDVYDGNPKKALMVLRGQKSRAQKNNEPVAPAVTSAIEELTLGGKAEAQGSKQSQTELFGASETEVAPGQQTQLIAEDVPAEFVTETNEELADFRRRVRVFGVTKPKGSLTWEDLGYHETRPPAAKKNGEGRSWDQWLEDAYDRGLISDAERSDPATLGKLLRGKNKTTTQVSEEGVNVPGAKALSETHAARGGTESVADIMSRVGLTQTAPTEAPTPRLARFTDPKGTPKPKAKAKVPRKITVDKLLAGVPDDVIRYDPKAKTIEFDNSDAGIEAVREAMDKSLDAIQSTPSSAVKYEDAYNDIMDAVFVSQQEQPKPRGRKDNPESGYINIGAVAEGIKAAGRTLMGDKPFLEFKKGLRDAKDINVRRLGEASTIIREAEQELADLRKAWRESAGKSAVSLSSMPEPLREQLNEYLRTEDPTEKARQLAALPEQMQAPARRMRELVDATSRRLLSEGVATGATAEIIEDNTGTYLRRTYKIFKDPDWKNEIPESVKQRARKWLEKEHPDVVAQPNGEQEITKMLNGLLNIADSTEPVVVRRGRKLGTKDLNTLMRRNDFPQEILDLWGVEKDGVANFLESMTSMAHMIANHKFYREVAKAGEGQYIFSKEFQEKYTPGSNPEYERMNSNNELVPWDEGSTKAENVRPATETGAYGALQGAMVHRDFKKAMQDAVAVEQVAPWIADIIMLNAWGKMGKTVFSPSTQALNLLSNTYIAQANGHLLYGGPAKALSRMKTAIGMASTELTSRHNPKWRELGNRATRLRVMGDTDTASELQALRSETKRNTLNRETRKLARKIDPMVERAIDGLGDMRDFAIKVYQGGDDVWKAFAWLSETEHLMDVGMTREQAEAEAALRVRRTYPTYTEIPNAVQKVRRFPVAGPFVSFVAEIPRNSINTLMQAQVEIRSDNPKVRAMGYRRAAGIMSAIGSAYMAEMLGALSLDMDDDDQDALRKGQAPWDKNTNIMWSEIDRETGKARGQSMSRTNPYGVLFDPVNAFLRADGMGAGIVAAAKEIAGPYVNEEIAFKALRQQFQNMDDYNRPIFFDSDDAEERFYKRALAFWKVAEPGAFSSIRRTLADEKPVRRALEEATGQRVVKVDLPKSLSFKASAFQRQSREPMKDVRAAIKTGDKAKVQEQYDQYLDAHKRGFDELHEMTAGMEYFGVPRREILKNLEEAGVGTNERLRILKGRYKEPATPIEVRKALR